MTAAPLSRPVLSPTRSRGSVTRLGQPRLDAVCVLDVLDVSGRASEAVRGRCLARQVKVAAGPWTPPTDATDADGWLGLLVVEGLITRTVDIDGLRSTELLGPGDLLRPWDALLDPDDHAAPAWQALQPSRLAVLDRRFAACAALVPAVGEALLKTTIRRSHSAAQLLSISRARRADDRLLLLLAHLADRWGRVCADGIRVPVRLTHQVIAELVCLRRPTVSSTLARLREQGRVDRLEDGSWMLPFAAPPA